MTLVFVLKQAPKGKARPRVTRGGAHMPDDYTAWLRQAVQAIRAEMLLAKWKTTDRLVRVSIRLLHKRPARRPKGVDAETWKSGAPTWRRGTPDIDNSAGSILDALTKAGVYTDDSAVVELLVQKRYAGKGQQPQCAVLVEVL